MTGRASVAMTAVTEEALTDCLVRSDGQEDLCLATYRPSNGVTRVSGLITSVIPPGAGGSAGSRECDRNWRLHPARGRGCPSARERSRSAAQPPGRKGVAVDERTGSRR